MKKNNKKYYNATSIRLMRFLYALGFEKISVFNEENVESWNFEYSDLLQKSLDFYFFVRNENRK